MQIKHIWQVSPPGYEHSKCFSEVTMCMRAALKELGHPTEIVYEKPDDSPAIVLGAHLLGMVELPPSYIIYNLENYSSFSNWDNYEKVLRASKVVWDFSPLNISKMKEMGIEAKLCEVGYNSCLDRIIAKPEVIDVLFYGSRNERRDKILWELKQKGLSVMPIQGYGINRDAMIGQSKVILNLHFYQSMILEIVRCSWLMSNSRCVVTEYGNDKELESQYYDAMAFADYDKIVDKVVELVNDRDKREAQARMGREIFGKKSQVEILKCLI